jgi:AcrR family transcriptional regulator
MARTIDPARHRARRLAILDAALTCIAAVGYDRATTSAICREAGIGSGTLFHYFPTKPAILAALFEEDTRELRELFAAVAGRPGRHGLAAYVDRAVAEAADPRVAGLVHAVWSAAREPEVVAVLADNEAVAVAGVVDLVRRAQAEGSMRTDLEPEQVASWLALLVDGFFLRVASDESFRVPDQAALLRELVASLLDGSTP